MKKHWIIFLLVFVFLLPNGIAKASPFGDGEETDPDGEVTETSSGEIRDGNGEAVDGFSYGKAVLTWKTGTLGYMKGKAVTGLDTSVINFYDIYAQVLGLYKDGVSQGGTGVVSRIHVTGGASVTATKTKSGNPVGSFWRNYTQHVVSGDNGGWGASLMVEKQL